MKQRNLVAMIVAITGTLSLLGLSVWIAPGKSGQLSQFFLYQGLSLCLSGAAILLVRLSTKQPLRYLRTGVLNATAAEVKWLGITNRDNWQRVGLTFLAIISAVTALFMLLERFSSPTAKFGENWLLACVMAIPLSVLNSFNEEILTRWVVVEGFAENAQRFAPWFSAIIFGSVHFFGTPGGLVGSLMAGFLGWFLARSIQETRGIGWAFMIHFAQDVIILTFLLEALV